MTLTNDTGVSFGRWTRAERARLSGILTAVGILHLAGWAMYLAYSGSPGLAGGVAGAGTLAYALGVRHAFDADHVAAIDDTTRLMMMRGRRPVGVGFFFAMGHSAVVLVLAVVVALGARSATSADLEGFSRVGGVAAVLVATTFLLLVAALNAQVLVAVARLWRGLTRGELDESEVEAQLLRRGLMNRMFGARVRGLVRSSWHMAPVGFLFGLGMETASEVTLLALSASSAAAGDLPLAAVLSLPILFAAGMSAFDTADSLLMARAYSWGMRSPARRLYYNLATTGLTVAVAVFVASVYLAGFVAEHTALGGPFAAYGSLADHFELFGYGIVAAFAVAWVGAALLWRYGGFERRYGDGRA